MEKNTKKSRTRSPGYPMIDLKEAISKARILWDKDKVNTMHISAVYENLGYQSEGGYAARVVSALRQFGLISEKDNGIILTQNAVDLALYSPSDIIYKDVIKKIALNPTSYRKIYDEYNGSNISDATLRAKLVKEYGFNPDKVNKFINNFRSTLDFAGLTRIQDIKQEDGIDMQNQQLILSQHTTPALKATGTVTTTSTTSMQSFLIPLSKGRKAAINFESLPVDVKDVKVIKDWLDLFSASLTESENKS